MKTILIDGHSIAFRAFFALGDLKTKDDFPTSVIHGFTSMLKKVINEYNPDNLIIAWDVSRKTFRTQMYKEYKANRSSSPDSFKIQIPELQKLLSNFKIAQVSKDNYEADDVLGSLAKKMSSKDNMVYILTGDRDSFQLINKYVNVIYTKKGISETEIINDIAFNKKYGIKVNQYIDYLSLKGDPSDNIPGVPGIGEKTALELLKKYNSLEGIIDYIDELKPKQKENLVIYRDQMYLSKQLATIVTNLNLEIPTSSLKESIFNNKNLIDSNKKMLQKFELTTFLKSVGYEKITAENQIFSSTKTIYSESWVGIDKGRVFVMKDKRICVFGGNIEDLYKQLSNLNEKFYVTSAALYYKLMGSLHKEIPKPKFSLDILTYILNSNSKPDSYERIAKYYKLNNYKNKKDEEYDPNLIEILNNVDDIYNSTSSNFKNGENRTIYDKVDSMILPILVDMSIKEICIDKKKMKYLSKTVSIQIEKIRSTIIDECGMEFNLNSPKQLSQILYQEMKLPVLKKTPKGAPSTDASVLNELSKKYNIAKYLLEYREIEKLRSTYIDGLLTEIVDGKIHSTFNLFGTTTGRLSSEKPNLQNIPIKTELGRKIREFFIPSDGKVFIMSDYSQIELRVLAHMSQDSSMNKILSDRTKDIHIETAARIFGVNEQDVSYDMRRKAKEINFGLLYGMEAFGLAKNLNISRKEATKLIDSYFLQFPKVKDYLDEIVISAKEKGYTKTVYGRRRYIPELQSQNKQIYAVGKRMAMNAPIQGTAADIVKLAMIDIKLILLSKIKESDIVLQIHDEIIVECLKKDAVEVEKIVVNSMESVKGVSVPLYVNSVISLDLAKNN